MTNQNTWDAVHTVIGFIKLNGLNSMTSEKVQDIASNNSANFEEVKSMVATHYSLFGEVNTENYIKSL